VSGRPSTDASDPELWLVDLATAADALAAVEVATPRLSPGDETKIARISDASTRRERHAAHVALRILVERAFGPAWRGVPYAVSAAGKPSLAGTEGAFSLSHVPGLALIGLARRGAIGVDVERLRPLRLSDERRERIERAALDLAHGAPLPDAPQRRSLQAWVRIEAAAKADGCGVGPLLTRLGVARSARSGDGPAAPMPFAVHDIGLGEGLAAAVALSAGSEAPAPRVFPGDGAGIERLLNRLDC
jgi:4'-phosphopantetheinyl transferase